MSRTTSFSTKSSLIERVQSRDAEAWTQFTELYGPLIYAWCRRRGLGPEDAADAMQEVLLGVAQGLTRFQCRGPGSFRAWLWAITANKVHNHFRRFPHDRAAGGTGMLQRLGQLPDPLACERSDNTAEHETGFLVHRGLAQVQAEFEPRTWRAFCHTVLEGQDTARVAALLKTTPANIRQARSRVLRRLREQLNEYFS